MQPKECEVCGDDFIPDVRVGTRQKVCFKLGCQLERKRRAQKRWVAHNPDYYRGRYWYVKEWLAAHPGI